MNTSIRFENKRAKNVNSGWRTDVSGTVTAACGDLTCSGLPFILAPVRASQISV